MCSGSFAASAMLNSCAQVPAVEQARHVGGETRDPELRLGPAPRGGEAREGELPLRIERIVEVEHQDEAAHGAGLGSRRGWRTRVQVPHREPEHGGRARLVRKSQRQRHLRQQGGDAERRLRQHARRPARRP